MFLVKSFYSEGIFMTTPVFTGSPKYGSPFLFHENTDAIWHIFMDILWLVKGGIWVVI